jgi:hypothetical protein
MLGQHPTEPQPISPTLMLKLTEQSVIDSPYLVETNGYAWCSRQKPNKGHLLGNQHCHSTVEKTNSFSSPIGANPHT